VNSKVDYTYVFPLYYFYIYLHVVSDGCIANTENYQAYDSHCNLVLGDVEETVYIVDEDEEDESGGGAAGDVEPKVCFACPILSPTLEVEGGSRPMKKCTTDIPFSIFLDDPQEKRDALCAWRLRRPD